MTILDHVPHAARRKGYAAHYAPSNLALFEPEMHEFTLELVHVRAQTFSTPKSLTFLTVFTYPR